MYVSHHFISDVILERTHLKSEQFSGLVCELVKSLKPQTKVWAFALRLISHLSDVHQRHLVGKAGGHTVKPFSNCIKTLVLNPIHASVCTW